VILSEHDVARILRMPLAETSTSFPVQVAGCNGQIAAWVFAPPAQALGAEPVVLDLYTGWPHSKRYWHIVPSWDDGSYSFAQYMVEHYRCIVIASDDLGLGESTKPADGMTLTRDTLAEAHVQVADAIRAQLAAGTLTAELPPLPSIKLIGVGQGTGAFMLHRVQAAFSTYDAVAFLGWTHGAPQLGLVDRAALIAALHPDQHGYAVLPPLERQALRQCFYRPDVPQHLIDLDERQEAPLPGGLVADLFRSSAAKADAKAIQGHVFLGFGDQDMSRNPSVEAACYPRAASVTECIQPDTAHFHHFAPTRQVLWKALGLWLARLAAHGFAAEPLFGEKEQTR
jgi:hypothetical protein